MTQTLKKITVDKNKAYEWSEEKDPTTIGLPKPSAFKNTPETGPDLSSDWSKYSTPEESRARIGKEYRYGKIEEFKNPSDFFIVTLNVQDIYNLNAEQKIERIRAVEDQCRPTIIYAFLHSGIRRMLWSIVEFEVHQENA